MIEKKVAKFNMPEVYIHVRVPAHIPLRLPGISLSFLRFMKSFQQCKNMLVVTFTTLAVSFRLSQHMFLLKESDLYKGSDRLLKT